jgi:hypothetical protein
VRFLDELKKCQTEDRANWVEEWIDSDEDGQAELDAMEAHSLKMILNEERSHAKNPAVGEEAERASLDQDAET